MLARQIMDIGGIDAPIWTDGRRCERCTREAGKVLAVTRNFHISELGEDRTVGAQRILKDGKVGSGGVSNPARKREGNPARRTASGVAQRDDVEIVSGHGAQRFGWVIPSCSDTRRGVV